MKENCRGMTLVEMLLALAIFAVMSTGVMYMLVGACNLNRFSQTESTMVWDADFAWHRIYSNGMAAIPAASSGMTPTVTTDANGQSRLTFIVPDVTNNTTRTLKYYCTGSSAPYSLVEDDPRYNVSGTPNVIARNVSSFSVTLDSSTTMKIWCDLRLSVNGTWPVRRRFCVQCRDF
jgi:prepilin-type N-terminal cleavage/methylation domain-containing protein